MILTTNRLIVRKLTLDDSPFFYELVNDTAWIKNIGDRNVQTLDDAEDYLKDRIIPSYANLGFGFYAVVEKQTNAITGISGFIKRDELQHVDVGFAFLPEYRGKGYAFESTNALMNYGKEVLGFKTILGIANNDNQRSHLLLEKIGLKFKAYIQLNNEDQEISLFST